MRLWITGANGMLGAALMRLCTERGIYVMGTGKDEVDITQVTAIEKFVASYQPTHVINCAAYTNVDGAESEYEKAYEINAQGAENIAKAALDSDTRLVHISTDYVFDGRSDQLYLEHSVCSPVNAYGRSKWEGEKKVLAAYPQACIVRTSWIFGSQGKNFLSSLLQWLRVKEVVDAVDDQWGRLTYAPDLAGTLLDLLGQQGIFHFANQGKVSRYQVAQFMRDEMVKRNMPILCAEVRPVSKERFPLPARRPTFSVLATDKVAFTTGKCPRAWMDSVKEFLNETS